MEKEGLKTRAHGSIQFTSEKKGCSFHKSLFSLIFIKRSSTISNTEHDIGRQSAYNTIPRSYSQIHENKLKGFLACGGKLKTVVNQTTMQINFAEVKMPQRLRVLTVFVAFSTNFRSG